MNPNAIIIIKSYRFYICEIRIYHGVLSRHNLISPCAKSQYDSTVAQWFNDLAANNISVDTMRKQMPTLKTMFNYYVKSIHDCNK